MEFPASRDCERQKSNILRTIGLLVVAGSPNGWVIARIVYGELSLVDMHTSGLRQNPARTKKAGNGGWEVAGAGWRVDRGILLPLAVEDVAWASRPYSGIGRERSSMGILPG